MGMDELNAQLGQMAEDPERAAAAKLEKEQNAIAKKQLAQDKMMFNLIRKISPTGSSMFAASKGMGATGAAVGGGALAAAMVGLTSILGAMVDNSVIVQTVLGVISKILGLALDLFLMPFIPLVLPVLISLVDALTWAGGVWKDIVDGISKGGIGALLMGLGFVLLGPLGAAMGGLFAWLFPNGKLNSSVLDIGVSITATLGKALAWVEGLLNWLFTGQGDTPKVVSIALDFLSAAWEATMGWADGLLNWLFTGQGDTPKAFSISLNLLQGAGGWLWDMAQKLYGGVTGAIGTAAADVSNFATGGSGSATININGNSYQSNNDLLNSVGNFLRSDIYKYTGVTL